MPQRIAGVVSAVTCGAIGLGLLAAPASAADRASLVMDANSGRILYSSEADAPRYPASLTKMMTLYLAFELIEKGRLSYDSRIKMSAQAASQPPSKLELDAGDTISVRDAVSALVTKSANDIAVAMAEHIGGSEANFARLMTRKARELGMTKTTFKNASGLPNTEQLTTARDMVTLGIRLQDDFPSHFKVFSTRRFTYAGSGYRNHNTLLYHYRGTEGIKTGYTRASGFNLVASVRRDGKHLVAAVFGGSSAGQRNATMRAILDRAFPKASARRTRQKAPMLVAEPRRAKRPAVAALAPTKPPPIPQAASFEGAVRAPDPARPTAPAREVVADAGATAAADNGNDEAGAIAIARVRRVGIAEHLARRNTRRVERAAASDAANSPASISELIAAAARESSYNGQSALGMQVNGAIVPAPSAVTPVGLGAVPAVVEPAAPPAAAGATEGPGRAPSTLQEQLSHILARNRPATPAAVETAVAPPAALRPTIGPAVTASAGMPENASLSRPRGVLIQIGAYDSPDEAQRQLKSVRDRMPRVLGQASPVTETVTRGDKLLYRARFAGLDSSSATEACLQLRRQAIDCFVARPR